MTNTLPHISQTLLPGTVKRGCRSLPWTLGYYFALTSHNRTKITQIIYLKFDKNISQSKLPHLVNKECFFVPKSHHVLLQACRMSEYSCLQRMTASQPESLSRSHSSTVPSINCVHVYTIAGLRKISLCLNGSVYLQMYLVTKATRN